MFASSGPKVSAFLIAMAAFNGLCSFMKTPASIFSRSTGFCVRSMRRRAAVSARGQSRAAIVLSISARRRAASSFSIELSAVASADGATGRSLGGGGRAYIGQQRQNQGRNRDEPMHARLRHLHRAGARGIHARLQLERCGTLQAPRSQLPLHLPGRVVPAQGVGVNPGKREMDARQRRVALGRLLERAFAPVRADPARGIRARAPRSGGPSADRSRGSACAPTARDGGTPCRGDRCTRDPTARARPGRGTPSPGTARCRPARRRRPAAGGRPARRGSRRTARSSSATASSACPSASRLRAREQSCGAERRIEPRRPRETPRAPRRGDSRC